MIRKPHILKPNHRTETWDNLLFFDTETTREQKDEGIWQDHFRLAWTCYVRPSRDTEEWLHHTSAESVCSYIESKATSKKTLYVLAHNLYYDLTICYMHLYFPEKGWKRGETYIPTSGLTFYMELRKDTRRIVFVDTMNYFQVSLSILGKQIGEYKEKIDFATADEAELSEYCKQDVNVIRVAITQLVTMMREQDFGKMQKTCASLAFSTYRHRFMPCEIFIHNNPHALSLERAAYHGGRVEVFRWGSTREHLWKLDVNSMYPFVMSNGLYPKKLIGHTVCDESGEAIAEYLDNYYVVARCVVETDSEVYPCQTEKRLIYPVGCFTTVLGNEGLRFAFSRGHLVSISEIALYEKTHLFREYVTFFYERRKEARAAGNIAYAYFYKLLMNTLYGKWGQRQYHRLIQFEDDPLAFYSGHCDYEGVKARQTTLMGTTTITARTETESYNSFPLISAAVTENARLYLWQLIETAGIDNLYYCDTDSLIVSDVGKERLQEYIGDDLGQLKIEGESTDSEFFSPKDYRFGSEIKRKGIRKEARWNAHEECYEQEQWQRLRGALTRGDNEGYKVKTIQKRLHRKLETRMAMPGGETLPFVREERTTPRQPPDKIIVAVA